MNVQIFRNKDFLHSLKNAVALTNGSQLNQMLSEASTIGDIMEVPMAKVGQAYLLTRTNLIQEVLRQPETFQKGAVAEGAKFIFPQSPVVSEVEEARPLRKAAQPFLHGTATLNRMVQITDYIVYHQHKSWHGKVDLVTELKVPASKVPSEILFSGHANGKHSEIQELLSITIPSLMARQLGTRFISLRAALRDRHFESLRNEMFAYFQTLLHQRLEEANDRDDLFNVWVQQFLNQELSSEGVAGNALSTMSAWQDPVLELTLRMIEQIFTHSEVLDKVRQEIEDTVNLHEPLTYEALRRMKYLNSVIKETARLYPPFWYTVRQVPTEGATLGEYELKGGSLILMSFFHANRHQIDWKHPDRFLPERYEDSTPAVLSYGYGERFCLGKEAGEMQAAVTAVNVFPHFDMLFPDGQIPLVWGTMLTTPSHVRALVKPRN